MWGFADGGPLNEAELAGFDARGYLTIDELLSEREVVELTDAIQSMAQDPTLADDPRVIREPDSAEARSVFEVHRLHPRIAALAADERLLGRVRQILGSDIYLHQARANLKPPLHGQEFYWHSDFETWHHEDGLPTMRTVSASIALTENRIDNGSLMIVPGSHRTFVGCAGATPENHHEQSLRRQVIGTPSDAALTELVTRHGIDTICGPAGSAVLFDCNCMHGSNGNITPFARCNLFFVYNSVENPPGHPVSALEPRPSYIGARTIEKL